MDLDNYSALIEFLGKEQYPLDYTQQQREHLHKQSNFYLIRQNQLYKRNRKNLDCPQRVIKFEERKIVIYNMHTDPLARHFEKTKTIQKTLACYYWPTLGKDIAEYIKTCNIYQRKDKPNRKKDIHPISISFAVMAAPKNLYLIEEELFSVHWLKNFVGKWEYVINFPPLTTLKQMA
ncbi:hypothetical protein G9A89_002771 [Geosiphon pyriformis]|nr:hypothetical protein G9A89_002771 [Geosiphon pyriformis]